MLYLINDNAVPGQATPRNFTSGLSLLFLTDRRLILSVVGGSARPARFSVAEAKLYILTLCHYYNEPISQRSGRKTETVSEPPSHGIWSSSVNSLQGTLGRYVPSGRHIF